MPYDVTFTRTVSIPTLQDYADRDSGRARLAEGVMAPFWALVVTPESLLRMEVAIDLGRPAVAGIADRVRAAWESLAEPPKWDTVKQFTGSAAALLCEANGFRRQGEHGTRKRRVGREHWNVGQLFERV